MQLTQAVPAGCRMFLSFTVEKLRLYITDVPTLRIFCQLLHCFVHTDKAWVV